YPSRLHSRRAFDPLRLSLRLRADGGATRLLLRHGRQPRQLAGQPLLGLRQAREDPRQGVPDLLVVEQRDPLAAVESPGRLAAVTRRGLRPPSEASPQGLGARAKPTLAAEHREVGDRSRMSCLILPTDL